MNAPAAITGHPEADTILKRGRAHLHELRDRALDRIHRMPGGWTREILVMVAEMAQRVASYPATSADEKIAQGVAMRRAYFTCLNLLEAATRCEELEGIEPL